MRAVVIHNPSSGMSSHDSQLRAALAALQELGWDVSARETRGGGEAMQLARQAAEQGCDAAFAVGGDGTLNEVLNGVLGSETAIGVLPLGTANVWATEMGMPLNDLARAAVMQAQAAPRRIDVGIARSERLAPRAFLLSCGAGFDASVIRLVEGQRELKRRWGKLFFVLVGFRQALEFRGRRVQVTVDGQTYDRRVILALVSNSQLYGGFVRLPPDALIDDGILDVTLLHGINTFHTAWHFARLGMGMFNLLPDTDLVRGREVEIRGARLPLHLDAEPVGSTPVQIEIRSRAVRIFVPATASRRLFTNGAEHEPTAHLAPGASLVRLPVPHLSYG